MTYVVRGEQRQHGALGWGTEWQSEEIASLQEARRTAQKDARGDEHFNIRIHEVKGNNGANYPLIERVKE